MICNRCGIVKLTVGDIRGCVECSKDGTRSQIPISVFDATSIEDAVKANPGLGNRFGVDHAALPAPAVTLVVRRANKPKAKPKAKAVPKKAVRAAVKKPVQKVKAKKK